MKFRPPLPPPRCTRHHTCVKFDARAFSPMFQGPGKWIDAIVALSNCLGGKEIAPTLVILRRKTSEDKKRRFDRYETMWGGRQSPVSRTAAFRLLKLGRASSTGRHEIDTKAPSVSFCTSEFALLTSSLGVKQTTDLLNKTCQVYLLLRA